MTEFERMNQSEEQPGSHAVGLRRETDTAGPQLLEAAPQARPPAEAIRLQEQQYQTLIQAIPQLVWMTTAEGMPEYFNQRWLDYTAFSVTENLESNWAYLVHPEDRATAAASWMNAVETGEPYEVEYRLRRYDGVFRWFLVRGVPLRDDYGQIARWFGTCTDIDKQKREEEKQRFLARLSDETRPLAAPDEVMWTAMRLLGDHLQASRSTYNEVDEENDQVTAHRDYCLEGESILGAFPLSAFGPALLDDLRAGRTVLIMDTATDPRTAPAFETMYQRIGIRSFIAAPLIKEGRLRTILSVNMLAPRAWTEDEAELVAEVAERTWLAVQSAREGQERQRAESALRAAEAQLRLVTDAAPLLISYVDREQRFRFNNQTYVTWFERPLEEITGKHVRDVLGNAAYEGVREYIEAALSGQTIRFEQEMPYQSTRQRYVQITFVPDRAKDDEVKGFVAVVSDLTERKSAEQALHASEIRFRMLVEQSPLSIQILAPDGRTIQVNQAWEQLWGVTLDDLRDYNMLEDKQLVDKGIMPYIRRAFAGEAVAIPPILYDTEQTLPNRTSNPDSRCWTQAFMYPVKDEAGRIREVVLIHEDITERKRMEEALLESEKRIRLLADNAPAYISNIDTRYRYLFANRASAERFGLRPEEIVGKTVAEVMGKEAFETIRPYMERAFQGETFSYESAVPYERLGTRYMQVFYAPDFAENGSVRGLIAVVHDITERKEADRERAYLGAIVHSSEDAVVSTDLNGIVTSWNPAAERIYGYTAEEIVGKSKALVIPPELPEELPTILRRIRAGERIEHYETVRLRKDGARVNLSITVSPIRDSAGQIIGASTIARDITERILAEQEHARLTVEIANQRKRLDDLISSVPGVVWEAWGQPDNENQRINFVSDHVEAMLGYTVEEWVSTPNFWLTIVHPEDREQASRVAAEAWASGSQHTNAFRWIRKDGQALWCEAYSVVVRDAEGAPLGMRGVTLDVSQRKQAEIERERYLTEIERLNERLRQSIRETHHRVKNNLQILAAMVDLQTMEGRPTLPASEFARLSRHIRALAAVHDVLTVQGKEEKAEAVSVRVILEKLLPMLQQTVGERRLFYSLDDALLPIRQVSSLALCTNELVSNAVKHGRGEVHLSFTVREGSATLVVSDNGPGFPSGFDPDTAANTGLQLIRNLAAWDLRGKVDFDNAEQGGARVTLTLPLVFPIPGGYDS